MGGGAKKETGRCEEATAVAQIKVTIQMRLV